MKKIIITFLVFGIAFNLTAQKRISPDTLSPAQLNVYKDKAVRLRNAGTIVTLSGVVIVAAGWISSSIWMDNFKGESGEGFITLAPAMIGTGIGIPAAIIGIPLWAIGGNRNSKAGSAFKKFQVTAYKSKGLELGITMKF